MNNDVHYSSKTTEWETPQDLFDGLNKFYKFTMDVCATNENKKCEKFFSPEEDGLKQEWKGVCWMNPPYGRGISKWIKKAHESGYGDTTVVCLIPARTDTKWWHEYVLRYAKITFIKGRLRFGNSKENAPFPSAIAVFGDPNPQDMMI